jgi:hypothetical protein
MLTRWAETLEAINGYVAGLTPDTEVYLAAFSSEWQHEDYRVLRNEPAASFQPLTNDDASPSGGTPLLDSMATMLDTAFTDNPELAYIVIMTDGEENSSRHNNKKVIEEKLARAEDRNWEVIFLGADFASVHNQSTGLGLSSTKSLNMSVGNYKDEFANLSNLTNVYTASAGTVRTNFSSTDQARAETKKK